MQLAGETIFERGHAIAPGHRLLERPIARVAEYALEAAVREDLQLHAEYRVPTEHVHSWAADRQ